MLRLFIFCCKNSLCYVTSFSVFDKLYLGLTYLNLFNDIGTCKTVWLSL